MNILKLTFNDFKKIYNKSIDKIEKEEFKSILYCSYDNAKRGFKSYSFYWNIDDKLSEERYDRILEKFKEKGFKTQKLKLIPLGKRVKYTISWENDNNE